MRKTVRALLMIAISMLWVAAGPGATSTAGAATSSAGAAATVPASALGVAVVGAAPGANDISVTADPGGNAARSVAVTNHSPSLRLTVRLDAVGGSGTGPGSWLTLSDVVETLEPLQSATVAVTIAVPANAVPGNAAATLRIRVDGAERASDGAPVPGNPSASVPVTIKVNGAATAQVSIVSVRAAKTHGKDALEIKFQNVGATSMELSGHVQVQGKALRTYSLQTTAAPLTSTLVYVPWVKPEGSKGVNVSVDAEDALGDQASWSGVVGAATPTTTPARSATVASRSRSAARGTHVPVLLLVLIAFALAAVWLGYEVTRARARRVRIRPRVGGATIAAPPGPATASGAVASDEQIRAVATQLAALVGAIDRLVGRLDGVPEPSRPALGHPVVRQPAVTSVVAAPAPRALPRPALPAPREVADEGVVDSAYPYDWPTEQELDRFVERRRAAGTDLP